MAILTKEQVKDVKDKQMFHLLMKKLSPCMDVECPHN